MADVLEFPDILQEVRGAMVSKRESDYLLYSPNVGAHVSDNRGFLQSAGVFVLSAVHMWPQFVISHKSGCICFVSLDALPVTI